MRELIHVIYFYDCTTKRFVAFNAFQYIWWSGAGMQKKLSAPIWQDLGSLSRSWFRDGSGGFVSASQRGRLPISLSAWSTQKVQKSPLRGCSIVQRVYISYLLRVLELKETIPLSKPGLCQPWPLHHAYASAKSQTTLSKKEWRQ